MNGSEVQHKKINSAQSGLKINFIYNGFYQIFTIILPLITAPYVTRVLGANNLGVYSYTQAFANYFYLFAMLGVVNYGNRTIAKVRDDSDLLNRTFWEIFTFQLIVALILSASYVAYCFLFISNHRLIYILQFWYVLSSAFDINWVCFGLEKFKVTTIRSTVIRICVAISTFVFVNSERDLWLYTFILSFGSLISVLSVWPFVLNSISFVKVTWNGVRKHIKHNLILFWPVVAVSLYNIMDKLMLGYFSNEQEVGFYTYAENIVQIPNTLILALDNVVMPRMSNLIASKSYDKARTLMNQVMMFAMFMGAAMAFGLASVGKTFAPWFYGRSFERCGLFIVILCPIIVFKSWAGALRTQFIIPMHKDQIFVVSLTVGAFVNLVVNFALIPSLSGVGAIIGTIIAEFIVAFIQFYMTRKDIPIKEYFINGVSFCVIGLLMFLVVNSLSWVGNSVPITLGVQITVGVLIYVPLGCFYMLKMCKKPVSINELFKLLRLK